MARATLVAIGVALAAGCGTAAPTTTKAQPDLVVASGSEPPGADAAPAVAPPVAPPVAPVLPCEGADMRRYGTTCCEVRGGDDRAKFPGMTFLSCHGPQIGAACQKKGDCDVACFCDDPTRARDPRSAASGPADGTLGVTGVCGGRLQIGVWMCQIDEKGAVTHVIVD